MNKKVSAIPEKLRIEQTKSRARFSNYNAPAHSKNTATVRKYMGCSHLPKQYAKPINAFSETLFDPWLNLHGLCIFAINKIVPKSKARQKRLVHTYTHNFEVCWPPGWDPGKQSLQQTNYSPYTGRFTRLIHLSCPDTLSLLRTPTWIRKYSFNHAFALPVLFHTLP